MEAAHVAVVSVDLILAVPILLSLVVLVCQRLALHRHPSTAPPHVANRPLAFLLSLHVLLFCLWLPSLLAVLLPNSFPCPLLLIPLYCFSHLVLSLLTIAGVRLHLHSSINARIFARLLPSTSPSSSLSPSPSPSASLTLPGHSPHSSLTSSGHPFLTRSTYTDNAQEFCITITSVDDSAPSTPSSHAEAAVRGDLDGDRVKNHRVPGVGAVGGAGLRLRQRPRHHVHLHQPARQQPPVLVLRRAARAAHSARGVDGALRGGVGGVGGGAGAGSHGRVRQEEGARAAGVRGLPAVRRGAAAAGGRVVALRISPSPPRTGGSVPHHHGPAAVLGMAVGNTASPTLFSAVDAAEAGGGGAADGVAESVRVVAVVSALRAGDARAVAAAVRARVPPAVPALRVLPPAPAQPPPRAHQAAEEGPQEPDLPVNPALPRAAVAHVLLSAAAEAAVPRHLAVPVLPQHRLLPVRPPARRPPRGRARSADPPLAGRLRPWPRRPRWPRT